MKFFKFIGLIALSVLILVSGLNAYAYVDYLFSDALYEPLHHNHLLKTLAFYVGIFLITSFSFYLIIKSLRKKTIVQ